MPRELRPLQADGWYHVTNRGAARQDIFRSDVDRMRFLELLAESVELFEVEIHAYCLMGNHFHILVFTRKPNLDRAMHRAMSIYVREFNRRHNRDGPLFKARYFASLITEDSYLMAVTRYIHRNPIDLGFDELDRYIWSSYGQFTGLRRRKDWLTTSFTLQLFGTRRAYSMYVEGPFNSEIDRILDADRPPAILGPDPIAEQTEPKQTEPGTAA